MKKVLYMVLPCFNEEDVLDETARRLLEKIRTMVEKGLISENSRVVFVNDGSTDRTWEIITRLHSANKLFSGICLAHNSGEQNAYMAGMAAVKDFADIVITMDADLQDDINAVDEMVNEHYKGNEIVYGVRSARKQDSVFKRVSSGGFYKFMKMMGIEIVADHSQYRLMSKRAVEALFCYGEVNLFLPCIVPQLGFKHSIVYYERSKRYAGKTKYSPRKLLLMASDAITSFSLKPIQMINIFVLFSFIAAFAGLIAMAVNMSSSRLLFTSVWLVSALQLISIRIIGEYIGKAYTETKRRPRYFISESLLESKATEDLPEK